VPTLTSTSSTLMCVPDKSYIDISTSGDASSALVSQRDDRTHSRKPNKGRHKCDHCGKLGHKIDRCNVLHGRPLKTAAVVQATPVPPFTMDSTSSNISGPPAMRIVRTLVPLHLLHIQVSLLLGSPTSILLVLGF